MRVLVTGASGYIGRFLLEALADAPGAQHEHEVHAAYGSDVAFAREFGALCASVSPLDLCDAAAVAELVRTIRPEVVVHLAAISAPLACERDPATCASVNEPTCLLDAIVTHAPAARLINFSSDQVYAGRATADRLYAEDMPAVPVNEYGRSKLRFERVVESRLGAAAISLRCSLVLGPKARGNCKKQTFLQFALSALEKTEPRIDAFDNEYRCAVDVADVVACLQLLIASWPVSHAGVYNLGGPQRLTRADIALAVVAAAAPGREGCVVPTHRDAAQFEVVSPADICLDSSRLVELTGLQRSSLEQTVRRALRLWNR
mmetsp:Transcript_46734/g.109081  ORF Transcript_46734/g.109081 Transcript_46734/m.109081 type:complete len:318 (+) Transcript_46734:54-1007(+)